MIILYVMLEVRIWVALYINKNRTEPITQESFGNRTRRKKTLNFERAPFEARIKSNM